jgi:DNA uptake protein ComE-like DNA-binding protein
MRFFLAGLGTGMALGVLFAPRSGSETREQLRSKGEEYADLAKERAQEVVRGVQKQAERLKQQAADLGENAGSRLKNAVQSAASQAGLGALTKLNTASREELMRINGIGPVLADRMIAQRPFTSTQQVLDRGLLPEPAFRELMREFEAA